MHRITTQPATRPRRSSADAERLVAEALQRQGWVIVGRNIRYTGFELDVVARKGTTLIIVEVKARPQPPRYAADATNLLPRKKLDALRRGALWIARSEANIHTLRIDLAIVYREAGAPKITYHVAVH